MAQGPLPLPTAWRAVARCFAKSLVLLGRRATYWPEENVGREIVFADGTRGRVYRETAVAVAPRQPCVLIVSFRLKWVRGAWHTLFRIESILNTPLFIGFPGFVSKLWLAHDRNGTYRGIYEWDGAEAAEAYARSLWRVLSLVSEGGSIGYRIVPDLRRGDVLSDPSVLGERAAAEGEAWWRVVAAA